LQGHGAGNLSRSAGAEELRAADLDGLKLSKNPWPERPDSASRRQPIWPRKGSASVASRSLSLEDRDTHGGHRTTAGLIDLDVTFDYNPRL